MMNNLLIALIVFTISSTECGKLLVHGTDYVRVSPELFPSEVHAAGDSHSITFGDSANLGDHGYEGHVLLDTPVAEETHTVTVLSTNDVYTTLTDVHYNSIPVTVTQFFKTTLTRNTVEVLKVSTDDFYVTTRRVARTVTHPVTNVATMFKCLTDTSRVTETLTHTELQISHVTYTSTIVSTLKATQNIIHTHISTSSIPTVITSTIYKPVYHRPSHEYYPY